MSLPLANRAAHAEDKPMEAEVGEDLNSTAKEKKSGHALR